MFNRVFQCVKTSKEKKKAVVRIFSEEESFIANRIEIFARQFGLDILPAVELFANAQSVTPLRYGIQAYRVRPETTSFQHRENGDLTVHTLGFDLNMQVTAVRQHEFLGLTLDPNDRTHAGPRQIACLLSRRGFIFNPKGESFENGDYGNPGERKARKRPFTFETSTHDIWRARSLGLEPSSEWTVDLNKAAAPPELQSRLPDSFDVIFSTSFVPQRR
ncbi:hypothetical protein JCM5353_003687 [Sporobolomyces roseus]